MLILVVNSITCHGALKHVRVRSFHDKGIIYTGWNVIVVAMAKWLVRQIADPEVPGSSPHHNMEELSRSSLCPLPLLHSTQPSEDVSSRTINGEFTRTSHRDITEYDIIVNSP